MDTDFQNVSLRPQFEDRNTSARLNPFVYVGMPELMNEKRMTSRMGPNGVSGSGIASSDVGHYG